MRARRPVDRRRVKLHQTYSVDEAARALAVHPNTVRAWLKQGLQPIDQRRPVLIRGATLKEFLASRIAARKQPCGPNRLYCLRCRAPRPPAGNMVDFTPKTAKVGDLEALCPDCTGIMHRRINTASLARFETVFDVTKRIGSA